jgi:hypothetical protein
VSRAGFKCCAGAVDGNISLARKTAERLVVTRESSGRHLFQPYCFSSQKLILAWSLIRWLCSHSIWRVVGQLTGQQGKGEIAKRVARRTILET